MRRRHILVAPFGGPAVASPATVAPSAVAAVAAVAEHMHGNKGNADQYPNPILRKPFHFAILTVAVQMTRPPVAR